MDIMLNNGSIAMNVKVSELQELIAQGLVGKPNSTDNNISPIKIDEIPHPDPFNIPQWTVDFRDNTLTGSTEMRHRTTDGSYTSCWHTVKTDVKKIRKINLEKDEPDNGRWHAEKGAVSFEPGLSYEHDELSESNVHRVFDSILNTQNKLNCPCGPLSREWWEDGQG